ncbi:MAG: cytochrome c [Deltaproteobacteria bacterium]|nr:cytochrome c [Deltaproteobacteria bacterium]
MRIPAVVGSLAVLALSLASSCKADLETTCVAGTCEPLPPSAASSTSASSAIGSGSGGGEGGQGGAGGSVPACFDGCDVAKAGEMVGDYPCAVERIMVDNCARCHTTPAKEGAPFALDAFSDSQQLYVGKAVFALMKSVVESGFMPLKPPELTEDEVATLVDWVCACAPPRPAGETCP